MGKSFEEYPPQFVQEGDGFRHIKLDEAEWLARPAPWGIAELPEPARTEKQSICKQLWRNRGIAFLAEQTACVACRRVVEQVRDEDPELDDWHQRKHPPPRDLYRQLHPELGPSERCASWPLIKPIQQYVRSIFCRSEMLNQLVNAYLETSHAARKAGSPVEWVDRRNEDDLWDEWIALELVGPNPFRPVALAPGWGTSTAVKLARTMYDARDFTAMPVLADALEDAGCDSADVLAHCRGPGPHVRGCWVVDLVLGRPSDFS